MSDDEELARAGLSPGTVIKGRWRVDGVLGVGGMASVYAATHRNGNRVAIKVLHRELSIDAAIRKRFLREGYASNAIAHPGVVRVHDDDVTDDGAVFFTMDLLEGESLEGRAKRVGYKFAPTEILGTMYAVLDILAAAHEKGIVHRDIKPANIFIASDGAIKLLDFGVAQIRNAPELQSLATHAGAMLGTPAFMAPEQASARRTWSTPARTSGAVGASMYYLLTGQAVHQASTLNEQLVFAATKPARSLGELAPSLPKPVVDVVGKALAFDREARYSDARAMQEAIARVPAEMAQMTTSPAAGALPIPPQSSSSIAAIASARTLHATAESLSSSGASQPALVAPPLRKRTPLVLAAAALVAVIATVAVVSQTGPRGGKTGDGGKTVTTVIPLPPPAETIPEVALPPPTSTTTASAPPASATATHTATARPPPPPPSASTRITVPTPHPPPSSSNWLDQR